MSLIHETTKKGEAGKLQGKEKKEKEAHGGVHFILELGAGKEKRKEKIQKGEKQTTFSFARVIPHRQPRKKEKGQKKKKGNKWKEDRENHVLLSFLTIPRPREAGGGAEEEKKKVEEHTRFKPQWPGDPHKGRKKRGRIRAHG